jgi:hypothetical protein
MDETFGIAVLLLLACAFAVSTYQLSIVPEVSDIELSVDVVKFDYEKVFNVNVVRSCSAGSSLPYRSRAL